MNERRSKEQYPNELQYTNYDNSYISNENSRNNKFSHPTIIPISPNEIPASQPQHAKTNTKRSAVNKVETKDGTVSSSPTETKELEDHGFHYPDAEDLKTKYLPKLKVELNELPYKIHPNNIDLSEQKRSRLLNVRITQIEEKIWSKYDSWYNDTTMNILLHW